MAIHQTHRVFVFIALLIAAWIVMTSTHELGHIAGGWIGGATLTDFDLAPWRMPFSMHAPNPHPQLTLWCGPLLGVVVPAAVAFVVRHRFAWFIADFCLLANGSYLALAWLSGDSYLDTPRMLTAGIHPIWIALYCAATIIIGYLRFRNDCIKVLSPINAKPTE